VLDAQAGFASGDYMSHRVSSLSGAAVGPEQLSTLLDSVRELITILSPDGLIQFTTQAFSQVLGHRTEAFVGIAFTSLVHPNDAASVRQCLGEIAASDAVLWLWTTNTHLRVSFEVVEAWGFEYKTLLTWVKDRFGTGD